MSLSSVEIAIYVCMLLVGVALLVVGGYMLSQRRSTARRAAKSSSGPVAGEVSHCADEKEVRAHLEASSGPVFVLVHATWCGYCKRLMAMIEDVAAHLQHEGPVLTVEGEKAPELVREHGIRGFPVMLRLDPSGAAPPRKTVGLVAQTPETYAQKVASST